MFCFFDIFPLISEEGSNILPGSQLIFAGKEAEAAAGRTAGSANAAAGGSGSDKCLFNQICSLFQRWPQLLEKELLEIPDNRLQGGDSSKIHNFSHLIPSKGLFPGPAVQEFL